MAFSEKDKALIDRLSKIGDIEGKISDVYTKVKYDMQQIENVKKQIENERNDIQKIIDEKTLGFPWLAQAFADYYYRRDLKVANFLESKSNPANKAADVVRGIAKERREAEKKFRITKYLLEYYEKLFPWLVDFKGEDLEDYIESHLDKPQTDETSDPVMRYVTKGEWEKLSPTERNQKALDRYWKKQKAKWEIGRDYERYIGYLYEMDGYSVYYQGIIEGFYDLGRDLIAKKNDETHIIQCKYWSKEKTIHEKHIMMLFGSVIEYAIKNKENLSVDFFSSTSKCKTKGMFITHTHLSDVAKDFASSLKIGYKENFPLTPYPAIKCNISRVSGEKIYHLPMDQQYDKTIIEQEKNECYVETVIEAEKLGFRRAWRWTGNVND